MHRHVLISATMLLTLAACDDPTAATVTAMPVAARAAAASEGNVLDRTGDVVTFGRHFYNECVGESVWGEGEVHVVRMRTRNGTGDERELYHANPRRVTGVGELSGDRYHMVGAETRVSVEAPDGDARSSFVQIMRLVSEGSGRNLSIHAVLKSRVVDGQAVWEMDEVTTTCR